MVPGDSHRISGDYLVPRMTMLKRWEGFFRETKTVRFYVLYEVLLRYYATDPIQLLLIGKYPVLQSGIPLVPRHRIL